MKYATNITMPAFYDTTEPTADVHGEIEPLVPPAYQYEMPLGGFAVLTAVFIDGVCVLGDLSNFVIDWLEEQLYDACENEQIDKFHADTREEEF